MVSMTDALKRQDYIGYIDLTHQLKNLSVLAFEEKDFAISTEINRINVVFRKHIDSESYACIKGSRLYKAENVDYERERNADLKVLCEYRLSGVLMRLCVNALRKTILREQVPDAQSGTTYYKPVNDLKEVVSCYNEYLQEQGIPACAVEVRV